MPTVPTYEAPTVAPQEAPNVQQYAPRRLMEISDIGPGEQARVGQEIQSAGANVGQIVDQQRMAATKGQVAQWVSAANAVNYDPTNGYMNMRGQDAVNARQGTIDTLQKLSQSLEDQLPDDASKQMFRQAVATQMNSVTAQINQHASQQTQVWSMDSSKSRAQASANAAITSYNPVPGADNKTYLQNLAAVHNELETQAGLMGMDDDTKQQYIQSGVAQVNAGVVSHLLENNQTQGARAFFNAMRDGMPPGLADKLDQQIKGAKDFDDVYKYTDSLQYDHPNDETGQLKQIASDFQAGKMDGNQRALAEAQVAKNASVQRQAQEQQSMNVLGNVADFAQKNPSAGIQDFGKAFPGQYALLKQTGHLETAVNFFNRSETAKTDPAVWFNIQTHLGDGSDKDITKMSDAAWFAMRGQMSDQDFKSWTKQRENELSGTQPSKDDPGNLHMTGFNSALNSRLAQIGIDPKKMTSPDDKARMGALQQYAAQWVLNDQQAAGRRFNFAETQKSLDHMFASSVSLPGYFGSSVGATTKPVLATTFSDIPSNEAKGIRQALMQRGNANPSNQDILSEYWRFHGRQ